MSFRKARQRGARPRELSPRVPIGRTEADAPGRAGRGGRACAAQCPLAGGQGLRSGEWRRPCAPAGVGFLCWTRRQGCFGLFPVRPRAEGSRATGACPQQPPLPAAEAHPGHSLMTGVSRVGQTPSASSSSSRGGILTRAETLRGKKFHFFFYLGDTSSFCIFRLLRCEPQNSRRRL